MRSSSPFKGSTKPNFVHKTILLTLFLKKSVKPIICTNLFVQTTQVKYSDFVGILTERVSAMYEKDLFFRVD
jgi:hypothetical protein